MFNSRFDVIFILPHKKSSWTDFGGIYIHIPPVATPLAAGIHNNNSVMTLTMTSLQLLPLQHVVAWLIDEFLAAEQSTQRSPPVISLIS